jgi:hypothetical protein
MMTTSGDMSHKEEQPLLQAKSLPNEYSVEPLNGPSNVSICVTVSEDSQIIIEVKRSQLDLPLEA